MSAGTTIEWTDTTWNPIRGCSRVSEGCRNCYAELMAARFSDPGMWGHGFAERTSTGGRWTGEVALVPEKLAEPLSWRTPKKVFVNSTSDLFHEKLPFEHIAAVFGVMAAARQHTFQVLTKRPQRAVEFDRWLRTDGKRYVELGEQQPTASALWWAQSILDGPIGHMVLRRPWPLLNVWTGTSIEDQKTADERIPHVVAVPAAIRFLSCEPLLAAVDLENLTLLAPNGLTPGVWLDCLRGHLKGPDDMLPAKIDWVIAGGESGPGARPAHPQWFRDIRDQCVAAGVPFFFKQSGSHGSGTVDITTGRPTMPREFRTFEQWVNKASTWVNGGVCVDLRGRVLQKGSDFQRARDEGAFPVAVLHKMDKKAAGRELDGRTWDEFPEVRA